MGRASRDKERRRAKRRDRSLASTTRQANRRVLRFVGTAIGLIALFQLAYYQFVIPSGAFERFLAGYTHLAAALLNLFGEEATASGSVLQSTVAVSVKRGCDALQPMAILLSAFVAFPGRGKLPAIAIGLGTLFVLNVVRIASLLLFMKYRPSLFETMHLYVWPGLLIGVVMVVWLGWLVRSGRPG